MFFGFVNIYASFQLDRSDFYYGNAKSTNRVLNYFATLGECLSYISEFEVMKYDLVWIPNNQVFSYNKDKWEIFMHMESENGIDLKESKEEELVINLMEK